MGLSAISSAFEWESGMPKWDFAKKCCSFVAQCTTFGYPDRPEIREWY